jgi:hypothetical protein
MVVEIRAALPLLLLVTLPATAATATWTGRLEMVTSVTGALVYNCEYIYAGQKFWRAFKQSCPHSVEVE